MRTGQFGWCMVCNGLKSILLALLLLLPGEGLMAQPFEVGFGGRIDCTGGACRSEASVARADAPTPQVEVRRNIAYQASRELEPQHRASRIEDALARIDEGGMVSLTLELRDEPFDFTQLRHLRGRAERSHVIQSRRAQLADSQQAVVDLVEGYGGEATSRSWLTNAVTIAVPAEHLAEVLGNRLIFDFSVDGDVDFLSNGWNRRYYTGVPITGDYEHDAETGNVAVPSSPIVVAVIDERDLNTSHVGWKDWPGGPSRVISTDFCEEECILWLLGCEMVCNGTANGPNFGHGNQVASILAASIQQGQDLAYPGTNTALQQQRSGLAKEAQIRYYRIDPDDGPEATRVAIEDSVGAGVDVINLSVAFNAQDASTWCNGNADVGGVRGAIRAATEAGALVVAAAGNSNTSFKCTGTTCNVLFPAGGTHVMAVGALAGTGAHLELKTPRSDSSCGLEYAKASDGAYWWIPMIDVATYGDVYGHPFNSQTSGAGSYATSNDYLPGTSSAAPVASSVAALVRQWMYNHGWSEFASAYAVRLNMLLSSNGAVVDYDPYDSPQFSSPYFSATQIGRHMGYGALRYHYFSYPYTEQLGNTGGWGIHKLSVSQGQTVTLPVGWGGYESNSITGWKFAAIADEDSYGAMPVGVLKVVDACSPGRPVVKQSVAAGRWKVFLDNAASQIHGKCLEVDFYFESTSGVDEVWVADYYFSNSIVSHVTPY